MLKVRYNVYDRVNRYYFVGFLNARKTQKKIFHRGGKFNDVSEQFQNKIREIFNPQSF